MMPAVLLLVFLAGCSGSVAGRWEILTISAGDEQVEDAGFVDLSGLEADRIGEPHVALLRYMLDVADGSLVPDPTPDTIAVATNVEDLRTAESTLSLAYPTTTTDLTLPAVLSVTEVAAGQMLLEDPDFNDGVGMRWLLSRSDALEPLPEDQSGL